MIKKERSRTLRKIDICVRRRLGPTSLPSGNGFLYWRERIFHYFIIALISIGLLSYLYYTISFLQDEKYISAIFSSVIFISTLFVSIVRTLPLKIRASWVLTCIYLLGGYLFIIKGPESLGLVLLLAYSILSAILLGYKSSVYSVVLNIVLLGAAFILHYSTFITHELLIDFNMATYLNLTALFVVVNIITLFPLVSFINGMTFSFEKELRYKNILSKEREKLMRAKIKAEESDVLKTSFLSNMSHEIRTPMNAILGFSNLLSHKEISSAEKEEFVNLIRINGKNLLTLVEDIIDISKIDSGQLQVKNSPVCLHEILKEVYDSFWDDIKRRGQLNIKLYLNEGISDKKTMILTDAFRLRQVLINLVGNGIKFTDRGFVEFGYELRNEEVLQFYIKDTGIGLPKGKEQEVFERFSKFSNDKQKMLYGGTGIGLSIAKDVVSLMGGRIWVESEEKVGSTFYFTIPYHKVSNVLVKPEDDIPVTKYNWEGKTFLVAEDEEDNFRYLEVALSISNASLIWARNGVEAVDIFNRIDNIDLVLMDIKMPEMDGYSATREIKLKNKNVPVIAQTAYAMSEEKEKSRLAGCDDYIAKPINYGDLLKVIHKHVPGTNGQ
ncbi:hybrid sensor histidine kinase/response regulator [Plebeiibacterium sediminum]|uniref:histidine kinase n=1 Tax=Plebeiibacterium sediminum TaxID=2992112 RepID=A0AAE3M2X0_9BACT|nr:ATP-binding protein [Plebeiobacterium sediminum]MCW3785810.1 ATP-binding protein [Plebeiobacterium sediminum]